MISFDEATAVVSRVGTHFGTEEVTLRAAHRRVLAGPLVARVDSPPCDVSAMDGYAVRDSDLAQLPATLPIAGESFAGQPFGEPLRPGTCVRIFTGAAIPAGADRVIVQEVVAKDGDRARFEQPASPARHIRSRGSDFSAGEVLLVRGTVISPGALVAAAGGDAASLTVYRQPRVRLLSTGDELVEPGLGSVTPGSIPESVSYGAGALAEEWGGRLVGTDRLPDDLARMERAAVAALDSADLLVVTGGASVGERDFAKAMFIPAGLELIFSKVSMKPGKPVWLGRAGGKLILGLPGNPTSALVTARLFLAPLLCRMTGRDVTEALRWRSLPLGEELGPAGERETFSRGHETGNTVRLFGHQDSSAQKVLASARLLVRRPAGDRPIASGTLVDVLDF